MTLCTCNQNAGDDINLYAANDYRYAARRHEGHCYSHGMPSPRYAGQALRVINTAWLASVLYLLAWFAGQPVSVCCEHGGAS